MTESTCDEDSCLLAIPQHKNSASESKSDILLSMDDQKTTLLSTLESAAFNRIEHSILLETVVKHPKLW